MVILNKAKKSEYSGTSFDLKLLMHNPNSKYYGEILSLEEHVLENSERKVLEKKLKNNEEWYNPLFKNNHAIMMLIDPNTAEIVDANQAACDFYGYSRGELTLKKITDINTLSNEEVFMEMEKARIEKNQYFCFNHRLASGEIRNVKVYSGSVYIDKKQLLFSIIHDITELKQAQKKIEFAYSELNQIFNTSADGMRVIDLDYNIIRTNDTLLKQMGLKREDTEGKKCYQVLPGPYCHTDNCPLVRITKGEERVEYEVDKMMNHEKEVPFIVTATPFITPEGKLEGIIENFKDIVERRKHEKKIKHLAYHDPLTNLPNRLLFHDRLEKALNLAELNEHFVAVMFLDLDEFKYINDTYGHHIGDEVLKSVAVRLQKAVRNSDTVARLGGDEFTILLTEMKTIDEIIESANQILMTFRQPFIINGNESFHTVSIGISIYPQDGRDPGTIIKHADIAMYHAKEQGKNSYQFFTSGRQKSFSNRFTIENYLRRAIERDEIKVFYQPQVCLKTGRVIGVEALVRWSNPDLGMVAPNDFIPLAEEIGLIHDIGKKVLYSACVQHKKWQCEGFPPLRVAVNLSVRQLLQPDLLDIITEILEKTELNPASLELEITESIALKNLDYSILVLQKLKEMGIYISLDDFGTGYSSLSYLKILPLDILKIDRSFVHNLSSDPSNKAIAKAIIDMAHSLNLKVVAEGVETEDQLQFLKELGCDYIQGYLYSKPLPPEELRGFLLTSFIH